MKEQAIAWRNFRGGGFNESVPGMPVERPDFEQFAQGKEEVFSHLLYNGDRSGRPRGRLCLDAPG
jgi:hypothetical protein